MIVVADTGPINYLVQLDLDYLLPRFYEKVQIPKAVAMELQATNAPEMVRNWIRKPPAWLQIVEVSSLMLGLPANLGSGESEAITLATTLRNAVILVDDRPAAQFAKRRNLQTVGTLAILIQASQERIIDMSPVVNSLLALKFYATPDLIAFALAEANPSP